MNIHATREQIVSLLADGLSNAAIARTLRCDKHRVGDIRRELGLPAVPLQPLSLEQKWATFTRPADGGHLEWTGSRVGPGSTPVVHYREQVYTAARIAFRIRHGHDPEGQVLADCGRRHCVEPAHVDDEPGRMRTREQLRVLRGLGPRPERCPHGHDQSEHGQLGTDGSPYCRACKDERKAVA